MMPYSLSWARRITGLLRSGLLAFDRQQHLLLPGGGRPGRSGQQVEEKRDSFGGATSVP
jgi:hypothetical protein